jgi:hypothetical protein
LRQCSFHARPRRVLRLEFRRRLAHSRGLERCMLRRWAQCQLPPSLWGLGTPCLQGTRATVPATEAYLNHRVPAGL